MSKPKIMQLRGSPHEDLFNAMMDQAEDGWEFMKTYNAFQRTRQRRRVQITVASVTNNQPNAPVEEQ